MIPNQENVNLQLEDNSMSNPINIESNVNAIFSENSNQNFGNNNSQDLNHFSNNIFSSPQIHNSQNNALISNYAINGTPRNRIEGPMLSPSLSLAENQSSNNQQTFNQNNFGINYQFSLNSDNSNSFNNINFTINNNNRVLSNDVNIIQNNESQNLIENFNNSSNQQVSPEQISIVHESVTFNQNSSAQFLEMSEGRNTENRPEQDRDGNSIDVS